MLLIFHFDDPTLDFVHISFVDYYNTDCIRFSVDDASIYDSVSSVNVALNSPFIQLSISIAKIEVVSVKFS